MDSTKAEENYLKAIYHLGSANDNVSTNSLAEELDTKASSVTDMIKKLSQKKLVIYKKYQGVKLTKEGHQIAIRTIRKHRLWEYFLVEKLNFKWDEVHELAEQLEHIKSLELTNRLDDFLDNPKYDPHGDPIPDKNGVLPKIEKTVLLSEMKEAEKGIVVGVNHSENEFLRYLEEVEINLGVELEVIRCFSFDDSKVLKTNKGKEITLSFDASKKIVLKKI